MPAPCAATICPAAWTRREAYADFALKCKARGYTAFKLHTWQPPMPGAPDPKRDVAACAAVREAVGDDMALMLDSFHYYSREEALYLGKELEKLNFYWLEEPMDEHSIVFVRLAGRSACDSHRAGRRRPKARCRPAPSGSCAALRTSAAAA